MHFIKILLLAIAIELMCCFGVMEKEKPVSKTSAISIEKTDQEKIIDQKKIKEVSASTPIQISIQ